MAPIAKTLLVCGGPGTGKTSLIRRFTEGSWAEDQAPTFGIDEEAGKRLITSSSKGISDELRFLLPPDGLDVKILEIGGKDALLREAPRGPLVDGLLLCYDVCDRSSFRRAAHLLMRYRTDRHFQRGSASLVDDPAEPPRLVVALCGTKADVPETGECDSSVRVEELSGTWKEEAGKRSTERGRRRQEVSTVEASEFSAANGIHVFLDASAKTGKGVAEVFQALLVAAIEADEEAEAERIVAARRPPARETWGLPASSSSGAPALTSPRGLRSGEPAHVCAAGPSAGTSAPRLLEVVDAQGVAYGMRTLEACLERGLLHRAVHVWFCDPRTGGLLLRKNALRASKLAGRWGPTGHGEVLCYGPEARREPPPRAGTGLRTAETALTAASRLLREQLGMDSPPKESELEQWFTCTNRDGQCFEFLDVFVVVLKSTLPSPSFQISIGEHLEWAHYTDIFGSDARAAPNIFRASDEYRSTMVRCMRDRTIHAHSEQVLGAATPPDVSLVQARLQPVM